MPYYNDTSYYYGGAYANHSSLMTGTGRNFHTPLSRFSPHLSTITESPLSHLHRFPPISVRHGKRVIDTADIDVSSPRILSRDGNRPRNRLRRDRPTIKIRSQALKDNPALRGHYQKHEKSVGELLMEKFFIKDKKADDEAQQTRLYHQINLDRDENNEEREAIQKRVTRRFTRRRSSADVQLDPEQLQREVTYAQVQAKVLDTLVAEEQAQIESEARQGTLLRKGTTKGSTNNAYPYQTNNSDSEATGIQEGDKTAASKVTRATKKAKKKKRTIDKLSLPDKTASGRSSISSEMSTDSTIEEDENGSRPEMYKIEASNSAGDFSTIWVNASENKKRQSSIEQFRESVKIPMPEKLEINSEITAEASAKHTDETETQIVLPMRKPYVKDQSRNSVYLTVKKPVEKLRGTIENDTKDDRDERLANGFTDGRNKMFKDDTLEDLTSKDSAKLNDKVQTNNNIKDIGLKKAADKIKKTKSSAKQDAHITLKDLIDDDDARDHRDIVTSATGSDVQHATAIKDALSSKNAETAQADPSYTRKNDRQIKQLGLSEDVCRSKVLTDTKRDQVRTNDGTINASEKTHDRHPDHPAAPLVTQKLEHPATDDLIGPRVDKIVQEEVGAPEIPAASREDVTRRSVVSIAGDTSENIASEILTPSAICLPKASKINTDRNNAREASELSLRGTAYLANSPKSELAEDIGTALPGKKVNKAPNLANAPFDISKKANGVDASELTLKNEDGATVRSKIGRVTLLEGGSEVRSNDNKVAASTVGTAEEITTANDVKPMKDVGLTRVETATRTSAASKGVNLLLSEPVKTDEKKSSDTDVRKLFSRDADLLDPKNTAARPGNAETKFPCKPKTFPKTAVNKISEIAKNSSASNLGTKVDDGEATSTPRKKLNAQRILKKSTSVDSLKSTNDYASNLASSDPKVLQQSTSVDEKAKDKIMSITKTPETTKFFDKITEKKPSTKCERPYEEAGQLSKSASSESIDFWSEIKASESVKEIRLKQQRGVVRDEATVTPKIKETTDLPNRKWTSSDSPSRKSSAVPIKESDDKKNESDVKISVAPGGSAVGCDVPFAEEKTKEKVVAELPKAKAEDAKLPKVPRKKKHPLIGAKEKKSTVKKAPLKRGDFASSIQSEASTPGTATPTSGVSTPVSDITIPIINIVEEPRLAESEIQSLNDENEDPSTPTNELFDSTLNKISKWSNHDDLTNAADVETPVPSEEASLTASPQTSSPQSSKTKRTLKKKKSTSEKNEKGSTNESTDQYQDTVKPLNKQTLAKPSPRTSPKSMARNPPSQRPPDLIKMFYTTPSALLTATPRDLSKVRRAKIRRRKHHSRTPSVSSDSTGSTTSTATTGSTDGSGSTCTELEDDPEHKRMNSTRSNDSGFDGSPRISSIYLA